MGISGHGVSYKNEYGASAAKSFQSRAEGASCFLSRRDSGREPDTSAGGLLWVSRDRSRAVLPWALDFLPDLRIQFSGCGDWVMFSRAVPGDCSAGTITYTFCTQTPTTCWPLSPRPVAEGPSSTTKTVTCIPPLAILCWLKASGRSVPPALRRRDVSDPSPWCHHSRGQRILKMGDNIVQRKEPGEI